MPQQSVLKQIRYEARAVATPSKDEWESLFTFQKQQDAFGNTIKGILQLMTVHPKGILLSSESGYTIEWPNRT